MEEDVLADARMAEDRNTPTLFAARVYDLVCMR